MTYFDPPQKGDIEDQEEEEDSDYEEDEQPKSHREEGKKTYTSKLCWVLRVVFSCIFMLLLLCSVSSIIGIFIQSGTCEKVVLADSIPYSVPECNVKYYLFKDVYEANHPGEQVHSVIRCYDTYNAIVYPVVVKPVVLSHSHHDEVRYAPVAFHWSVDEMLPGAGSVDNVKHKEERNQPIILDSNNVDAVRVWYGSYESPVDSILRNTRWFAHVDNNGIEYISINSLEDRMTYALRFLICGMIVFIILKYIF